MRKTSLFSLALCLSLLLTSTPSLAQRVISRQTTQYLQQRADLRDAMEYLRQNAETLGLTEADLEDLVVTDQYVSKHNGVTHLYLQQYHQGIPVYGAIINLNFDKNGRVLNVGNRFVKALQGASKNAAPSIGPDMAVQSAARELNLTPREPIMVEEAYATHDVMLSDGGIALEPIPARLVYLPMDVFSTTGQSDVRLAWQVGIYTEDGQHYWNMFVDAGSGAELFREDLVVMDRLDVTDAPGEARFMDVVRQEMVQAPLMPLAGNITAPARASSSMSGTYRVYAHPFESPAHAGDPNTDLRTLEANPADPTASPLGWHNDGTTSYTVTRGNNAHAYTDVDADGVPDPGSDPDGGGGLLFDFPFDPSMDPPSYRPAAVTNLFYWNNLIHDLTYQYGFDEASGNFQVDNFGNGGLGGDDVRAEAQDGSGTNNANFFTPTDGSRPRMQMFVWSASVELTVNSPATIAGDYGASPAAFGAPLTAAGTTGDLELVNDGAGASTTDACEPLVGFTPGNIAVLDRGTCEFGLKVLNAENAGAIAAIVVNNVPGTLTMGAGASGGLVTISSLMIDVNDGQLIKDELGGGVNATLKRIGADRDSDFDNGVIVHEYGHGVSNRLTGGPNTNCLGGQEQMGEGWSDYLALLLTDTDTDNRGIGTYVIFEPPTGLGIRARPYSTDFGVNEFTYDVIKTASVPHGVGHVWATMLWDMTRSLVAQYGFDSDTYSGNGGNNLALQLVMDGMKMQPCFPGFVDGRDAILAADLALTGGKNECTIWDSFANRGLGFSANQGSSADRSDGTEAFDLPVSCCTFAILTDKINALKEPPVLTKQQINFLLDPLQQAERKLSQGALQQARNKMNLFIGRVNGYVTNGLLTPAQAQDLLDCADGILNRILQLTDDFRFLSASPGLSLAELAEGETPTAFALGGNYPNPFNPTTQIQFALPEASHVRLVVYDLMGREVSRLVDRELGAGVHEATFDGQGLASGTYFYRIEAGSFMAVKQMILIK